MGVMAAFIFAAQMVNFPIVGGTSGHLIGAVLAAVTLGPWSASIIMAVILILQSLLFQDGGLTALGANILNMGVIAVFAGYGVYRLLDRYRAFGLFAASWVSVMLAAGACAVELAVAGTIPLAVVLPAMLFWHAFIGVGEGLITAAVVEILSRSGVALSRDTVKA
jgi:cobalt/nickel transport system permease protein